MYFTHDINDGREKKYTASVICNMTELLIDKIFVLFGGCLSGLVKGIAMGTNLI